MAKSKSAKNMLGGWAFLIGVLLAIVLGFMGIGNWAWVLVVIGLIIGLFNITESETQQFLMAGVLLLIAAYTGQSALESIPILGNILDALLIIFAPATIVVAIKHVFSFARN